MRHYILLFLALFTFLGIRPQNVWALNTGFDHGLSFRGNKRIQVLRLSIWRQAIHTGSGSITFRGHYGLDVAWVDGKAHLPINVLISLGTLILSGAVKHVEEGMANPLKVLALLPNSDMEINLDELHRTKIIVGLNSEFLVTRPEVTGIVLAPHVGVHIVSGIFNVQLTVAYNYHWRFSRRSRSLGPSAGMGLFSGPEFYWTSPQGFIATH